MIFISDSRPFDPSQGAIRTSYLADETECVKALLNEAALDSNVAVGTRARNLVHKARATPASKGLDAFLSEYDLGTREGIVLMCLAEGLLRIPDSATQDRLIHGLVLQGEWGKHLGKSRSLLVNASTWGLMLTGKIVRALSSEEAETLIRKLTSRLGDAALRSAMRAAMGILAGEFVIGQTIEEAISRTDNDYRYSFDMLGEAALTASDAERYYDSYLTAIRAAGDPGSEEIFSAPGVSIKLSALHPRYEFTQRERVLGELVPRVFALAEEAKGRGVLVTLDAEEADRLDISLDLFKAVYRELRGYEGFGLAVQAYQKRATRAIDWLAALAKEHRRKIPLRLVKGAYWDTEIKRAQVQGLSGYPVFTRKVHTDVSYLACGTRMLNHRDAFYPQFATHNAHTVAYFMEAAGNTPFEFQRLYGMGEALYAQIVKEKACRVYAPVGSFDTLLPYLVRRLLENGANTSFVNRIADTKLPIEEVIADPVKALRGREPSAHPAIPLPRNLYGDDRRNSHGLNLANPDTLAALAKAMEQRTEWQAAPLIAGKAWRGALKGPRALPDPADRTQRIGSVIEASEEALDTALDVALAAFDEWDATPAQDRARILERAAELFEQHRAELAGLIVREGGRIIPDALAEIREAADYCRYYAAEARRLFSAPQSLPGPSGEDNVLTLRGRGVFAALSPWNFPLAIFTGQITAALAAGNSVIAKPAEQTSLIAMRAVELLHEAGIPGEVLNFVPGAGESIGAKLVTDSRIAGVVFTGSSETALTINRALAAKEGPIAPLIAETGGMNAIIADSSALAEQLVVDVVQSAFNSAGQRCSAARLLFVQEDIADQVIALLAGAMAELKVGDPGLLSTDVGPLIDEEAKSALEMYCRKLSLPLDGGELERGCPKLLAIARLEKEGECFFAPRLYEISIEQIPKREVFGPILHVIRWKANELDSVIAAINNTGYGLTLGIHSRIDETIDEIRARVRAGNVYVNRNIIGAVVGVQPFGGEGLSGTGPKAGGPNYLVRFALERSVSVNTAAIGGNASLLALDDDDCAHY